MHDEWLTLQLRDPWTVGGKTYAAGALLATSFDDFMAGKRDVRRAVRADRAHLAGRAITWTRHHLVLNVLDDVKNRLSVLTPGDGRLEARAPSSARRRSARSACRAVDADDSDAVWLTATDYLTPTTLALAERRRDGAAKC